MSQKKKKMEKTIIPFCFLTISNVVFGFKVYNCICTYNIIYIILEKTIRRRSNLTETIIILKIVI